jgi:hypothetical protein
MPFLCSCGLWHIFSKLDCENQSRKNQLIEYDRELLLENLGMEKGGFNGLKKNQPSVQAEHLLH